MPCNRTKTYMDYIFIQSYFAGSANEIQIPFPSLQKTEEQAIKDLNKGSVNHLALNTIFGPLAVSVSLLRMYRDPKESEHIQNLYKNKESNATIEKELLMLGAEQGQWTIAEAIAKIKQHNVKSKL